MKIGLVSYSYRKTPLEFREKLKLTNKDYVKTYNLLRSIDFLEGSLILSTCNRTEIYFTFSDKKGDGQGESGKAREICKEMLDILARVFGVKKGELEPCMVYKSGTEAVKHLYEVTTGLKSQVIGEQQILGQVKEALQIGLKNKGSDRFLNRVFQEAITTAKRIREHTGLADKNLSLSSVCVRFLEDKVTDITNNKILVIGVGEISLIVLELLKERGVTEVYATNRTHGKIVRIKEYFSNVIPVNFNNIPRVAAKMDIIISSTAAPHHILKKDSFNNYYNGKRIIIFDLGVPRDIEPQIGEYSGIELYNIDLLTEVINRNKKHRMQEAVKATEMVDEAVRAFEEWLSWQRIVPVIKKIKKTNSRIVEEEIEKLFDHIYSDTEDYQLKQEVKQELISYSKHLEKQLFNRIILNLKTVARETRDERVVDYLAKVFDQRCPETG